MPFLQGFEARIKDFFDAAEFRAPQIAHVVKALVHGVKAGRHV